MDELSQRIVQVLVRPKWTKSTALTLFDPLFDGGSRAHAIFE
jgi:hypothetical protein